MIAFIKAKIWSGAGWLLTLCVILVTVSAIYLLLHRYYPGTDHKKLDTTQLTNIDNILSYYPDPDTVPTKLKNDTTGKKIAFIQSQREKRNQLLFSFLRNEYNNQVSDSELTLLNGLLLGLDAKDVKLYLTTKEIIVNDFFWFNGSRTYLEVLLWALIGVLVSLIYYVSIANGQALKVAGDADTGPFDPSEISGQVSKMFYAPICALVLVLGYNLLNTDNKMTDISIGKGLLLFSFICGFFSGRVMKFIDGLKNLVLPVSTTTSTKNANDNSNTDNSSAADITISLQLAPDISQSADGPNIVDAGFNSATVTLQPEGGGNSITLTAPANDQGADFTTKQAPFGKYTLNATMAFKKADNTIINLSASQAIEVSAATTSFNVALEKSAAAG